ncbi:MAG: hypothetical protein HWN65_16310 [Candidatus Helarchaeota archaeon]|nr:hypothetical protein [Candidatus Helarchaeota archaeon]
MASWVTFPLDIFKYQDHLVRDGEMKMGRIIKTITIKKDPASQGNEVAAVFDTGAERSYVKRSVLPLGVHCIPIVSFTSGLGGARREIREVCPLNGEIQGLPFNINAHPVEDIGIIDGEDIGVLVGATTMEQWDIKVHPKDQTLDLTGLRRREFIEL